MSLLKKINDTWNPSEKPDLKVGETLEVTNYEVLVRSGMAVLVDENGNELELPGQKFTCPICFSSLEGVMALTEHLSTHLKKNQQNLEDRIVQQKVAETLSKEPVAKETSPEVVKTEEEIKKDEIKSRRLAALEKARAVRKANKQ